MIRMMPVAELLDLASYDAVFTDAVDVAGVLPGKRASEHYPLLLAEVRDRGITVPVWVVDGELRNGHHRLAAAVELGLTVVPVSDVELCAPDEGRWQ